MKLPGYNADLFGGWGGGWQSPEYKIANQIRSRRHISIEMAELVSRGAISSLNEISKSGDCGIVASIDQQARELIRVNTLCQQILCGDYEAIALEWMAHALFCDTFLREISEEFDDSVRKDFERSREDVLETVPEGLTNYDMNILDHVGPSVELAAKMVRLTNEKWSGRWTVGDMFAEFGESPVIRLAMVLIGHGISPEDDEDVAEAMSQRQVAAPQSLYDNPCVYSATTALSAAILDELIAV